MNLKEESIDAQLPLVWVPCAIDLGIFHTVFMFKQLDTDFLFMMTWSYHEQNQSTVLQESSACTVHTVCRNT